MKQTSWSDGRYHQEWPGGDTVDTDASGNHVVHLADGRVVQEAHTGHFSVTHADGTIVQQNPDGSMIVTDGHGHTRAGVPGEDDREINEIRETFRNRG
jgi:hypothetical protein